MKKLTLTIRRGATAAIPVRVESPVLSYAQITTIANTAPVRITAVGHGIPDGWRAAVMNAKGLTQLNAQNNPPKDSELRPVVVVDADMVEINAFNAAGLKAHTAGTGQLAYYVPLDLAPYSGARMDVKSSVKGGVLATFNTADGTLELDNTTKAVWLKLSDSESLVLPAKDYVFDIELLRTGGGVEAICTADSVLTVLPEVTTTE